MTTTYRIGCLLCGAALLAGATGCKASPRQRPLQTSPINTGANTTNEVRRQLQGVWDMMALDIHSADGKHATVDASGRLTYDEFGNLEISYHLSEPAQKTMSAFGIDQPDPVISTSGQAAVNPQQSMITYVVPASAAFDREVAARRANPFALERPRYYVIDGDVLTLSTRYDDGKPAAVSKWKRVP